MRPTVAPLSLAILAVVTACAARTAHERGVAEVTELVRAAYGGSVRSVLPMVPARVSTIPLCPWDADGMPDAGYVLVVEQREVGAQDAIVLARTVCRLARPTRTSGPIAWTVERFTFEHRGAAWRLTGRDLLEAHAR